MLNDPHRLRNIQLWQQATGDINGMTDNVKIEIDNFGKRIFRRVDSRAESEK
jgi:hypothetical protein